MSNAANKSELVASLASLGFKLRPVEIKRASVEILTQLIALHTQERALKAAKPSNQAEREAYVKVGNELCALFQTIKAKPGASYNDLKIAAAKGNPKAISALKGYINGR